MITNRSSRTHTNPLLSGLEPALSGQTSGYWLQQILRTAPDHPLVNGIAPPEYPAFPCFPLSAKWRVAQCVFQQHLAKTKEKNRSTSSFPFVLR